MEMENARVVELGARPVLLRHTLHHAFVLSGRRTQPPRPPSVVQVVDGGRNVTSQIWDVCRHLEQPAHVTHKKVAIDAAAPVKVPKRW